MRGIGVIVLSLGALAAGAAAAGTDSAASRPGLRVTDLTPFTVRGFRFEPDKHLRVVITTKHRFERKVEANGDGRFRVVLRDVDLGPCARYAVKAYDSDGLRAAIKSPPKSCGADIGPT